MPPDPADAAPQRSLPGRRWAGALAVAVLAALVLAPAGPPVASAQTPGVAAVGYWLLGADGRVFPFGAAAYHGDTRTEPAPTPAPAVDVAGVPGGAGYVVLYGDCRVAAFGTGRGRAALVADARRSDRFVAGDRCTSLALTPSGQGMWVFTATGRAFPSGDATFLGDMAGTPLNGPVLDAVALPDGRGYFMVGSDGGVFAFGAARFRGSMGGRPLNAPVTSLVPDPDGSGYWLVARDGGVFAFDAAFRGSMGGRPLNRPVSGMVAYGEGYLLVAEDGGTFVFSNLPFLGSLGASPPSTPVVSVATADQRAPDSVPPPSPTAPPITAPPATTAPQLPGAPQLDITTFAGGLDRPWDLAFLPDGSLLFTERPGRIRLRAPDGSVRTLAQPSDVVAAAVGQSGMLGIAVDPDFAANRYVYTVASSAQPGGAENRVIRWRLAADATTLTRDADIVTGLPYRRTGNIGFHSGGALRFGPDGLLYVTIGDNYGAVDPQSLTQLGGKVLRYDRDGTPRGAAIPGAHPAVFTYGHRNPQGLAFRPGSGAPFASEHGPAANDEVTLLRAGGNGGWNPGPSYDQSRPMTDTALANVMRPTWVRADSAGLAGAAFVSGPQWRDWNGALVVASLAAERLTVLQLTADGTGTVAATDTVTGRGRLRSLRQGPDGALYVTVDAGGTSGQILRVAPR